MRRWFRELCPSGTTRHFYVQLLGVPTKRLTATLYPWLQKWVEFLVRLCRLWPLRGNGKELFLQIDEKPTSSVYLTVVLHCYNPSNGLSSFLGELRMKSHQVFRFPWKVETYNNVLQFYFEKKTTNHPYSHTLLFTSFFPPNMPFYSGFKIDNFGDRCHL